MELFARSTCSRSSRDAMVWLVRGSIWLRCVLSSTWRISLTITLVAMPLATSPALSPPMPSASTTSPCAASVAIESSLCERTIPGSVQLAISSTCARSMRLHHGFHFSSPGASLDGSHGRLFYAALSRALKRPENSVISGIFAVKPKLRQIFRRALARPARKRDLKRRNRLQAEPRARLHLARGNELGRGQLLAIAELRLAGVDAAALRGDDEAAVPHLDHLADLALHRAEGAHQLLAAVEELQLHAIQRGPGTGRRIGRADQVVDDLHMVRPVDPRLGL